MRALIDLGSEVNAIHPAYLTKLGLHTGKIDIGAQKIDASHLDIFGIVIADCSVKNKLESVRFFQKTFLFANIGLEIVLEMLFLTLSNADIRFVEQELAWRIYTAAQTLPITKRVEIIKKRKFAAAAPNADNKTFVLHVVALAEPTTMPIHLSGQAQVAVLTSKETRISIEYSDFCNVFSSYSAAELLEHTGMNNHSINLLDDKQLPYGPIYSLGRWS